MLSVLRANWKRVLATTVWTLLALNVGFFVRRAMVADDCDVDALIRRHRDAAADTASSLGDGCTFARNDNESSRIRHPPETNWCMYDDEVDLRIVILTFNRPASLLRLLRFVSAVEEEKNRSLLFILSDFSEHVNLLKVKSSHVHCKSVNILERCNIDTLLLHATTVNAWQSPA